ncbi:MAG: CHASE2 domain-containing protein, partial [Chthoniobacteraceae bacterium]
MNWLRKITARSAFARRLPRLLRKGRVGILLAWAAGIFGVSQTGWFENQRVVQQVEQALIDRRFLARGNVPANPDVVIVGINDSSLEQVALEGLAAESEGVALMAAQRFPWNRKVWAILIERLMQSGAKVVALDLILDGDNPGTEELAAVVAKYRDRLVLGARFTVVTADGNNTQVAYTTPATVLIGEADSSDLVGSCLFRPEIDLAIRRVDFRTSQMR